MLNLAEYRHHSDRLADHLPWAALVADGVDSVPFALQLSTLGNSGGTILVRAFAVDGVGDRGAASVRSIRIE